MYRKAGIIAVSYHEKPPKYARPIGNEKVQSGTQKTHGSQRN